ncbi:MAG: hypothetical protein DHS20C16_24080 [Phycisphaerae bacterium]|nr:MAG: hypothetical protein DHS20C16_24080 [Phycisphaerae bacterium]
MLQMAKDSQDVSVEVFGVNEVTGLPETGLGFSDVAVHYVRNRAAAVSVSLSALAGADAAHADGGFVEIDASAATGWYRLDLPDAAFAAGALDVTVIPKATGVLFTPVRAQIGAVASGEFNDEIHLCKAALVNKRVHTVSTGVDEIKDDDGTTTLVTMTPQDGGDDVIEIVPS